MDLRQLGIWLMKAQAVGLVLLGIVVGVLATVLVIRWMF